MLLHVPILPTSRVSSNPITERCCSSVCAPCIVESFISTDSLPVHITFMQYNQIIRTVVLFRIQLYIFLAPVFVPYPQLCTVLTNSSAFISSVPPSVSSPVMSHWSHNHADDDNLAPTDMILCTCFPGFRLYIFLSKLHTAYTHK